ncbi:hypothetical protein GGI23_004992 [Coemansia sp. RSA 2559]|nr:hypothetical protein GGI23_004992 [Coemansia sp. RSA 2559]
MSPIGEPLEAVRSVSELLVVLHDAMRCHKAINDDCNVLHRDVSDNNILVVRKGKDGNDVHGLLIDFDCAIKRSALRRFGRPERTGTLPFMSIGNLSNSSVPRTMLDDWESLLYLVCWYGTFGINNNCTDLECSHNINKWCAGNDNDIADQKQSDLTNIVNFGNRIVNGFGKHDSNPGDSVILKKLAIHLHKFLFFNPKLGTPLDRPHHGTRTHLKNDDDDDIFLWNKKGRTSHKGRSAARAIKDVEPPSEPVDPFEMRVEKEEDIAEDLLSILEYYADLVRK